MVKGIKHAARGCDNSSMCLQTHRAGRPELSTLSLQLPDPLIPHSHSLGPAVQVAECKTSGDEVISSSDPHLKEGSPSPNTIGYRLGHHCMYYSLPQIVHLITPKRRPCEEATLYLFSSFRSRKPVLFPFISPCFQRAHKTLETPYPAPTRTAQPWPPAVRVLAGIAHDTFFSCFFYLGTAGEMT